MNPTEFAHKMGRLSQEIKSANERAVRSAALEVTTQVRRNVTSIAGFDSRLSGVGRRGAKVGARYDVKRFAENPTALVRALGPMQLIENDTKAHVIDARKTRSGRTRRNAKPLATPFGPRWTVHHPGTRGRYPFRRGVEVALPRAMRIFQQGVREAMRKSFR